MLTWEQFIENVKPNHFSKLLFLRPFNSSMLCNEFCFWINLIHLFPSFETHLICFSLHRLFCFFIFVKKRWEFWESAVFFFLFHVALPYDLVSSRLSISNRFCSISFFAFSLQLLTLRLYFSSSLSSSRMIFFYSIWIAKLSPSDGYYLRPAHCIWISILSRKNIYDLEISSRMSQSY